VRPVNLLPEQHRQRRATGSLSGSAYVVVGVLGALLLAVLVYTLTANSVTDREDKTAQVRQEADRAEARAASLGAYGDFSQLKATRLASVTQVAQSRFDWERLVRESSLVLPADTWLTEVSASAVPGEAAGEAGSSTSSTDAAAASGPSATFAGCAKHQSDVAKLMVRLRGMHRVQDVSLNESTVEGDASSATSIQSFVEGCGRYSKFDLTVAFDPMDPSQASQGKPRRVPASLGGGS
jgi:Tfp pilus assembly protein PilN